MSDHFSEGHVRKAVPCELNSLFSPSKISTRPSGIMNLRPWPWPGAFKPVEHFLPESVLWFQQDSAWSSKMQTLNLKLTDYLQKMCGCVAVCVCLQFLRCLNATGRFTTFINFAECLNQPQENMGRFKSQQIHDLRGSGCSWHGSFSAIVKFAFTVNTEKNILLLHHYCFLVIHFSTSLFFLEPIFPKNLQPTSISQKFDCLKNMSEVFAVSLHFLRGCIMHFSIFCGVFRKNMPVETYLTQ